MKRRLRIVATVAAADATVCFLGLWWLDRHISSVSDLIEAAYANHHAVTSSLPPHLRARFSAPDAPCLTEGDLS